MNGGNVVHMDTKTHMQPAAAIDIAKQLQAMELNLLGKVSFADVARSLNRSYRKLLSIDAVSLVVFERENQDFRLESTGVQDESNVPLYIVSQEQTDRFVEQCRSGLWIGDYSRELHARFFPGMGDGLATVALLPLSRRAKTIGVLALGSKNVWQLAQLNEQERLNRLAAIVAVCVENLYNQELIRQVNLRDPLTGLFNRRYFTEHLNRAMSHSLRSSSPICCIYLDIDHFKLINDKYGHAAGDAVLCELGQRVQAQLRSGELCARIGGEEFCLLLDSASSATGMLVAERVRQAIAARPFNLPSSEQIDVTVSGGVADSHCCDPSAASAGDKLLDCADRALYQAKQQGRDKVVLASA